MDLQYLIFCAISGIAFGGCPNGFVLHGDSCYYVSTDHAIWNTARERCIRNHSADLVDIESKEELVFLQGLTYPANKVENFWLGARQEPKNVWYWVHTNQTMNYSNWYSGEPNNNAGVRENCMESVRTTNMSWNDNKCYHSLRYICERSAASTTDQGMTSGTCPNGFVQYGSSCYYLSMVHLNWFAARNTCTSKYKADLVDIESKEESEFVYKMIAASKLGHAWLGGRRDEHNNWYWIRSGNNLTFTDWRAGLPDQAGNFPENCMESVPPWNMKWNDLNCGANLGFICESSLASTDRVDPDPDTLFGKR